MNGYLDARFEVAISRPEAHLADFEIESSVPRLHERGRSRLHWSGDAHFRIRPVHFA
jgi:hypothetical protein